MRSHSHCRIVLSLALLALLNFIPQLTLAQGTAFTYDGLLQKGGTPQSGTFNFTFTLYNAATGGNAIATPITLTGVPVKTGAFTVTLDFGGAVWNGQINWLEIGIQGNGDPVPVPLTPRQQIMPTPYAIYAETANTVSGTLAVSQLNGTIDNTLLTHSTVTVAAGTGLGGGGTFALGSGTTLYNSGVTSLTGGDGVTVSGATGDLTLGLGSSLTLAGLPASISSGGTPLFYADINGNYYAGINAGHPGTSGNGNTGIGVNTLFNNSSGSGNTAVGAQSLVENSNGSGNTASGDNALFENESGSYNTANGASALLENESGSYNTANGASALLGNETGSYNVGDGANALQANFSGTYNTAVGYYALSQLGQQPLTHGGTNNIAIGNQAGSALAGNESSNIDIGNFGVAGENFVTRIGDKQTVAYIAGVITGDGSGLVNLNASQLTSGTISSSLLAGSPITVNTGPGLSSDVGQVAPGGTIKLFNTGVTSLTGGDGVTVSGATGDLTLGLGSTLTLGGLPVSINSEGASLFYADNNGNNFTGLNAGHPTSGLANTAGGSAALGNNATGSENTAYGYGALEFNLSGSVNTAYGVNALVDNGGGSGNVANGGNALFGNQNGSYNTANGLNALYGNDSGSFNAANGANALSQNIDGSYNTADGNNALGGNHAGSYNVGDGANALEANFAGIYNTAVGYSALQFLGGSTLLPGGTNNIAIGYGAGSAFTGNESSNIDIGNIGVLGENNITRIGTPGIQTAAYIAGIITGNGSGLTSISGSQITGGTIDNSELAHNSITISAGPGVTGGGTVSLGGSVSLGATSVNTHNTIVSRDGTGSFSAQDLTLGGILNLPAAPVIYSGPRSLLLGDYLNDLFVGFSAGNLTSSGGDNTGLGYESLQAVTSGYENVAVGTQSLAANTTGIYNVAVGYLALQQNTVGFGNAACGWESLMVNTSGWFDTGVGTWALQANTSGNNNTAVGYDSLGGNTTGSENTAFGVHANLANTTGSNNVAVGWWSLNNVTGGSDNIALGYQAGINFSGGESDNIDIGNAGKPGDDGVIRIGTPGIHVTTSLAGICNSHVGYGCLPGTAGTVFGNTFNFWWTNNQLQAWIDNVEVGVVAGTSDRRLKENIQPMTDDAVTRVMALKPSSFKYKNIPGTVFHGNDQAQEGFIADELQQVIPSAVNGQKDAVTSKGEIQPQTVNLMPVVAVLTRAVQDQQKEIDELKAMVKTLSERK